MPGTTPCVPCCSTPVTVQVPGTTGANGANGVNAFSQTDPNSGSFTVPAVGSNVTVNINANTPSSWMVNGETVFIQSAGYYSVFNAANPIAPVLTNLGYPGNANPAVVINAPQQVSPGGVAGPFPIPVTISQGGTNAQTKGNAQTNLGLGQAAQTSNSAGLTQAITSSFVQVGTVAVTISAAGSWLMTGRVRVSYNGVTFASSRIITAKIRNVTQGVDYATTAITTEVQTTTSFPDHDYTIPFVLTSAPVAADVIQILITINTINSAGTLSVTEGSLVAIPLNLS